jgi:drug/metabolite transporter (DMT)-like permease
MATDCATADPLSSAVRDRLLIVLAALLWSTSGAFTKVLTQPTSLGLDTPPLHPGVLACVRVLFAGLVLLPTLRRRDLSFRPIMLVMVACFTIMSVTFVRAMSETTAANAVVLQYTAPMWMVLASVWLLGEHADRRSLLAVAISLVGIAIIVGGGWNSGELPIVGVALVSGIAYAGVMVCLRVLRDASARWLTVLNHLASGLLMAPFVVYLPRPSLEQLVCLFLFGALQMAIPYWLVARGLRTVSPQEAGTITLLEPLVNPIWAYLVSGEVPKEYTVIGGALILAALVWRYWPFNRGKA